MTNNENSSYIKLHSLEQAIRKSVEKQIAKLTEMLYTKEYTNQERLFTSIVFSDNSFVFKVNYQKRQIIMVKYPAERINEFGNDFLAQRLQTSLFYKPILDSLSQLIDKLPNYYDLNDKEIAALKDATVIPVEKIQDRIATNFSEEYIPLIAKFLDRDYPKLSEEYNVQNMLMHLAQNSGSFVGLDCQV